MLNIDPYTILFTLINLLILFVAMKKVLFKPINDILESRAKTVQDNLEQAQRQREEAQALKAQYEEQLSQSRQQASQLLNQAQTQFNICLGLCVGHDSLFCKYSRALVTTLVAKDRATGNNPAAAIYCAEGYFKDRLELDKP